MNMRWIFHSAIIIMIALYGCGPLESGVIDSGFFNTGGTDDPRKLIGIAYSRMYRSNRIIGARNVLRRAIELSEKDGDWYALAVSYNMMAYTYVEKEKDPAVAEGYYKKAYKLISENNFECELVHYYVGIALVNEMMEIEENSCEYAEEAEIALKEVKYNFQHQIRTCEGGQKEIVIAEDRVKKLRAHFGRCEQ